MGTGQIRSSTIDDTDLFVDKGDHIAVIGLNGAGKPTLLCILMGKEEPDEGYVKISGQNVYVYPAYFEHNQVDVLDPNKTVVDTFQIPGGESQLIVQRTEGAARTVPVQDSRATRSRRWWRI